MIASTRIAPLNSLVLIADPRGGKIPDSMRGSLIVSSSSCIAVGCRSEVDGETEITLGAMQEVDPGDRPAFEGQLETPSRSVVVSTVHGQVILEASVQDRDTRVRVWVNDLDEPNRVTIGVA